MLLNTVISICSLMCLIRRCFKTCSRSTFDRDRIVAYSLQPGAIKEQTDRGHR